MRCERGCGVDFVGYFSRGVRVRCGCESRMRRVSVDTVLRDIHCGSDGIIYRACKALLQGGVFVRACDALLQVAI